MLAFKSLVVLIFLSLYVSSSLSHADFRIFLNFIFLISWLVCRGEILYWLCLFGVLLPPVSGSLVSVNLVILFHSIFLQLHEFSGLASWMHHALWKQHSWSLFPYICLVIILSSLPEICCSSWSCLLMIMSVVVFYLIDISFISVISVCFSMFQSSCYFSSIFWTSVSIYCYVHLGDCLVKVLDRFS